MAIGQQIKEVRKDVKMSQGEFAKRINVSKRTIWNYEHNDRYPESPFLQKLSKEFNVNLHWLLTGKGEKYGMPVPGAIPVDTKNLISVPLLGNVPAGEKTWVPAEIEKWYELPREMLRGKKVYLLRVKGDSMVDVDMEEGSLIIVDMERHPENGDIVVALIDDEATVKKIYFQKKSIVLQSANPKYPPQVFTTANKIFLRGVVVGKLTWYK